MNRFDLKDKVIIVTGGSGFLGSAYIRYLEDQGAMVFNWDLPKVDVSSRESVEMAELELTGKWGTPHGLINNAAIDFPPDKDGDCFAELEETIRVNLLGAINCCQIVGSDMAEVQRGSVVNIGSIYGINGPDQSIYPEGFKKPIAYSASKAGLLGVTKYLATLWGKDGIRVNQLTLGGVRRDQNPRFIFNYMGRVPLMRMAEPEDYFGAIHFLLSDASAYMTGANLIIDGGYTAW